MNGESLKSELLKKKTVSEVEKSKSVKNVIKSESLNSKLIEYSDEAWDYMNDFDDIRLEDL